MAFSTKILFSIGGLGNQLFVFNFAHRLLEQGAKKVVILNSWHNNNSERPFQLDLIKSNCSHNISFSDNLFIYKAFRLLIRVASRVNRDFTISRKFRVYIEGSSTSSNKFENFKFFSGYFQDYCLFPKSSVFLDEFETTVTDVYEKLLSTLSVEFSDTFQAIHVRRGDYISHRETFGILALDYFKDQIKEDIPLLVLSEEPLNYAFLKNSKSLLQIPDSLTPWQLMSVLCQASFLAGSNSTFSFWPVFYLASKGRQASIPTPWFRNHPEYLPNLNSQGLITHPAVWE